MFFKFLYLDRGVNLVIIGVWGCLVINLVSNLIGDW